MRRIAAATLCTGLLASCMVGPDYHRPSVDVPKAYVYEPGQVAGTADVEWWKRFGDPVLEQLITEALAKNWNVKIAAANVEQAAGVLTSTRAPLFPQLGYQANAQRLRYAQGSVSELPGVSNPTPSFQLLGGANWELDLWGRVRRLAESAQASLFATEEARRGVILSLVGSVANGYITLRGLDAQLEAAERSLHSYGETVHQMELQFQYGRASQLEVEQARSQYETAAAQIPQIRQQIVLQEASLSVLLARNPGPIARGKSISEISLLEVPPGVPSELLERRPDVLQAEQQLIAFNAQIGAAKAQYFPTISLTGAFGQSSTELSNLWKGTSRVWNYGGSIVGPIFTAGLISGQVRQAEAAQQAALFAYEQTIQSAFADVNNALSARTELVEQVAAQGRQVTALRNYERLARALYDGGQVSYTTVLLAEEQLFPAELNYAAGQAQLLASIVGIYESMGGGWIDKAAQMTGTPPGPE